MKIMHIALGGCLRAPPVQYGLTEDTGGHIAYIVGAAMEQVRDPQVSGVDIVTRAFAGFGPEYLVERETVTPKLHIRRLQTSNTAYLTKEALWAEVPALTEAFLAMLRNGPRPDVLHAHFADAARLAFAAGDEFGIPVVYTPHSLALDKSGAALREPERVAAERHAIKAANAIIVSSRDEAERQVPAYDPAAIGRTHRVAPGVTTIAQHGAALPMLAGLTDPTRPMILAVARPVAKKNLIALVRAFAATPALHDHANLVILAGQHATAEPAARAILDDLQEAGAGCAGTFALPPAHDIGQVAALYHHAAHTRGIFVNPALFEPFGLTLLEAAQAGLPVVATRHGGPSAIIADLDHGLLVEPTDTAALADACVTLLRDRGLWDAASANGKAGVTRYSWAQYAHDSVAVYRGLGARYRPARRASRLLVCDIDNTLTGCHKAAQAFGNWIASSPHPFIVATGRSLPEARAVLRHWSLPEPEAFITSVGTEVFLRHENDLRLWPHYSQRIGQDWNPAGIRQVLQGLNPDWQPDVDQKAHKISLFGNASVAQTIRQALRDAGLHAVVIHSHDRLIDVLPRRAGKANAIAALASRYGLGLADCIAAGDSGNDRDMLRRCGTAIVVGNAAHELSDLPARQGLLRVDAHFAGGVLEGLRLIEAAQ